MDILVFGIYKFEVCLVVGFLAPGILVGALLH
jgi:hypothetical protein